MIWISLQDEGRMPWEREELMVSVTKEQSSFAHFFRTKGGIPSAEHNAMVLFCGKLYMSAKANMFFSTGQRPSGQLNKVFNPNV